VELAEERSGLVNGRAKMLTASPKRGGGGVRRTLATMREREGTLIDGSPPPSPRLREEGGVGGYGRACPAPRPPRGWVSDFRDGPVGDEGDPT